VSTASSSRLVALAQVAATPDAEKNLQAGLALMEEAAGRGAGIVVFPEISFRRFFPQRPGRSEPFHEAEPIPGPTTERVAAQAATLRLVTIVNLFEKAGAGAYYDASPVIDADGSLAGVVRMQHLAEEPGFHEQGYYSPAPAGPQQVFDTAVGRIGVAICYDRHYASVMTGLALAGAELVCVPQAGATSDPLDLYEVEMRTASFQHGYQVALVNRVGREEVLHFAGRSFLTGADGEILARARDDRPELVLGEFRADDVQRARRRRPFLRDLRRELFRQLPE
jgi:N-carbamoylputrescine amidase